MQVAFIKQGVTSYGHIEAGIVRAAAGIPELRLAVFDFSARYHAQRPPLRGQPHPARMKKAVEGLLAQMLEDRASKTVLLLNGFVLEKHLPGFFDALRKAGKSIAGWQIDDPYYFDGTRKFVTHLDAVFTVDSSTVALYREMGKKAAFLPLACDPELHRPYGRAAPWACDVSFVGTPFAGSRRTRLIDELAGCLAKHDSRIAGATKLDSWKKSLARFAELEPMIRDARVTPLDAARLFSASRVNLNIHKDSYGHAWDANAGRIEARSPAERTFAIAGCGGFQLVDDTRPDLPALFEPGRELVTFRDAGDLAEKIDYYLEHEAERAAIAAAGQARAYAEHTYLHRLRAIAQALA